ncbi:MAG TPA: hypothetical protein DDY78_09965 [Planctomycetales bacterium]|jgi:hypothetical protein|nr:hypothetical protein [Planctomycetales bacterium]
MFATNRSGKSAGVLGLAFGCGVAVWLAGTAAAQVGQQAALPAEAPKDSKAKVEMFRKRYPLESLAKRLDYEPEGAEAFAKSNPPPRVTKETLKRLAGAEELTAVYQKYNPRGQALKLLHSDTAEKFIEVRDNFGMSRMVHIPVPTTVNLELAAAPSLRLAEVRTAASGDKAPNVPSERETASFPKEADLSAFHERGLQDFLNPAGFGFVKDRENVAGFQGHQFRTMPQLPVVHKPPDERKEQWAVIRLQLMSLLKYEQPAVYVSDNLPRMDELKGVPTRPLIPFEEKSLKSLRKGDDLATETSGDRIRMVGSLRASKQCLECHEVKRGDLLGAFSWELQRQPVDEKK